jgi:hypothetical protein
MPRVLRMPPFSELPDGPHRDFVEELFVHYRTAGRPTLRAISGWIGEHDELPGTASAETIRRVLGGKVQPTWGTATTILHALCALAGQDVRAVRWPEDSFRDEMSLEDVLRDRWNTMIDAEPLAARPAPIDPWASPQGAMEEPPF